MQDLISKLCHYQRKTEVGTIIASLEHLSTLCPLISVDRINGFFSFLKKDDFLLFKTTPPNNVKLTTNTRNKRAERLKNFEWMEVYIEPKIISISTVHLIQCNDQPVICKFSHCKRSTHL